MRAGAITGLAGVRRYSWPLKITTACDNFFWPATLMVLRDCERFQFPFRLKRYWASEKSDPKGEIRLLCTTLVSCAVS